MPDKRGNRFLERKTTERYLLALIVSGTVFRLLWPFWRNPLARLFSDPLRHWKNGGQFFFPELMGGSDPIVYQAFIWLVREVSHGNSIFFAAVAGVLSAVMPWIYYRAAREFQIDRPQALAIWAVLALLPSLFVIYNYVMMETLLLPLVGTGLWASARHLRRPSVGAFWLSGGVWTLACLTKPTIVPLAAVCLLWTWMKAPRKLFGALGVALLGLLILLPSTLRSWSVLGFPAPLGNPWITKIQHGSGAKKIEIGFEKERWHFISPSCNMFPLAPLSAWQLRRAQSDAKVVVSANRDSGEAGWKAAYEKVRPNLGEWLAQWGENILLFLFAPSWPDCNMGEWDGWLCVFSRWLWAPLIFCVMDCNVRDFLRRRFDLLPVATTAFLLFLMFQNVATSEGRYRKPLEPLLILNLVWIVWPSRIQWTEPA